MDLAIPHDPPITTKSSRLPRYQRIGQPPRMVMTERDKEILRQIQAYRLMTREQIERLLFSENGPTKTSQVRKRLKLLYHHGYVDRIPAPIRPGVWAWRPVYRLQRKGAEIIAAESKTKGVSYWGQGFDRDYRRTEISFLFLEHILRINDVRIAITLNVQAKGYRIEKWIDDTALKGQQMKEYVEVEGEKVPFIPDGYFIVHLGDRRAHFFLELDQATMGHQRWKAKVSAYKTFVESGKYQERYQTRSLRVLTVTTTPSRLENLKQTTESVGGDHLFWFTTIQQAISESVLSDPIWRVTNNGGCYALI